MASSYDATRWWRHHRMRCGDGAITCRRRCRKSWPPTSLCTATVGPSATSFTCGPHALRRQTAVATTYTLDFLPQTRGRTRSHGASLAPCTFTICASAAAVSGGAPVAWHRWRGRLTCTSAQPSSGPAASAGCAGGTAVVAGAGCWAPAAAATATDAAASCATAGRSTLAPDDKRRRTRVHVQGMLAPVSTNNSAW